MENVILSLTVFISFGVLVVHCNSPPRFGEYQTIYVQEGSGPNTTLPHLECYDEDPDDKISGYSLIHGSDYFGIDQNSGQLFLKRQLDYEAIPKFELLASCRDSGQPQLSSSIKISVQVVDINDNAPQFSQFVYSVSLPENSPVGMEVLRVQAADADSGQFGRVRYRLNQEGNKIFDIHPYAGIIYTKTPLDREMRGVYFISVIANDCPGASCFPRRETTAHIYVTVTDKNDNPPFFSTSRYQVTLLDNIPIGYHIITVTAIDFDLGANAQIEYSLEPGRSNPPGSLDLFTIDSASSMISVAGDLEGKTGIYHLSVIATDKVFKARATVEISVLESNVVPIG